MNLNADPFSGNYGLSRSMANTVLVLFREAESEIGELERLGDIRGAAVRRDRLAENVHQACFDALRHIDEYVDQLKRERSELVWRNACFSKYSKLENVP